MAKCWFWRFFETSHSFWPWSMTSSNP